MGAGRPRWSRAPMVRPGALWITASNSSLEHGVVQRAQFDREDLVRAIEARGRASADLVPQRHLINRVDVEVGSNCVVEWLRS